MFLVSFGTGWFSRSSKYKVTDKAIRFSISFSLTRIILSNFLLSIFMADEKIFSRYGIIDITYKYLLTFCLDNEKRILRKNIKSEIDL
ncbi:hypothetical protein BpHYR1_027427 [Brachionus plicatilis]|uniref:Uncharacterized protein n=1 Tax=Brachionus plicatilis TaxID=10195 RepID=A0A3M7SSM0_BRAPC|nr:hypothetical protein BpHYR1_027427 [Brachionus plicatilis]